MKHPKVLVLSYHNDPNFGDRLGYHLINNILPPNAIVHYATVKPWRVPDEDFDLLILGIGNSLNAATVQRSKLFELIDRIPKRIGIFGTQYRYQYSDYMDPNRTHELINKLDVWYARYQEDIGHFGLDKDNVIHLGDWLITAFSMTQWTKDKTLDIPPEIKSKTLPLDRTIQKIQSYRRVHSARIHPLLCALTSAEEACYTLQKEDVSGKPSGKFQSLLLDVFDTVPPEKQWFKVDREKVIAYKAKVHNNVENMKADIAKLLPQYELV